MKKFIYLVSVFILFFNSVSINAAEIKINKEISNSPQSINCLVGHFDNKINLVFSDIDGTILKLDKKNPKVAIPSEVKKSVKKLKKANIPFFLITGRSYEETKDIAKRMGYKSDYIITLQGGEITNAKGQLVCQDTINENDVNLIVNDFDRIKKENNLNSKIYFFAKGKLFSTETCSLPYNWEKLITIKSIKDLCPNYSCTKILIWENNPQKLRLIQSEIKKKYPDYKVDIAADCYCDISSPSATKGNAVKKISKMYNVDLKNVAVFGDSENDLSMICPVKEAGGLAVATDNGMEILKQNANYVTFSVYDCGFSKGVDEILKNNAILSK